MPPLPKVGSNPHHDVPQAGIYGGQNNQDMLPRLAVGHLLPLLLKRQKTGWHEGQVIQLGFPDGSGVSPEPTFLRQTGGGLPPNDTVVHTASPGYFATFRGRAIPERRQAR